MYEAHFGFNARPFAVAPDPRFLFLTKHHRLALTALEYGVCADSLITVLTGEVGSGKTTLVRHFIGLAGDTVKVGVVNHAHRGSGPLLQWVALAFGMTPRSLDVPALFAAFEQHLDTELALGRRLLLIVDEAQNLGAARLEELRVLSNVNDARPLALQMILVGQPELRTTLQRRQLSQLAQRVGADYHLGPLCRDETRDYIRHRLMLVGDSGEMFDPGAVDLAYQHSGGIPRLINQLCDTALVYAFAAGRREVDAALMEHVVRDRTSGGIFPVASAPGLPQFGAQR